MAVIKDSGERRVFESGAVRDMAEGKGRFDLIPIDVVSELVASCEGYTQQFTIVPGLYETIGRFMKTGDVSNLYDVLSAAAEDRYENVYSALLDLAKHFEDGAKKYGENNWQKGLPVNSYIDSALRHLTKDCAGWTDEPHYRAFLWNITCAIWTAEHHPHLNPYKKETSEADKV